MRGGVCLVWIYGCTYHHRHRALPSLVCSEDDVDNDPAVGRSRTSSSINNPPLDEVCDDVTMSRTVRRTERVEVVPECD